jgi:hypothetical protein
MSRCTQITCDECGAVKKDSNRWWSLCLNEFLKEGSESEIDWREISLMPVEHMASNHFDEYAMVLDLCSEACVHKTVSKYMRGQLKA